MKNPFLQYLVPGLLIGALGGYFVAGIARSSRAQRAQHNPREAFLSEADDALDYEKLARVCLSVAQQNDTHLASTALSGRSLAARPVDAEEVQKTKDYLDRLMSNALQKGAWTRMISFRARQLLGELPPSDAADFASLFATAVKHGDLKVIPGAWTPEAVN